MSAATPRRALVLGGGGVLGAAWMIGAMTALRDEQGWEPGSADVIVGTSAGSVLAGLLGCGVGLDDILAHQRGAGEPVPAPGDAELDYDADSGSGGALPPWPKPGIGSMSLAAHTIRHPRRVTPLAALAAFAPRGRGSLDAVTTLVASAAQAGGTPEGWASHDDVWIVTMDYESGRRVPFGRAGAPPATLPAAVTASCAIPGWYTPVDIGGRRYVDGGTCSPASIDLLAGLGLDEVVVLAPMVSLELDQPHTLAARAERRLRVAMTRRSRREARAVRASGTAVTLLGPGPEDLEAIGANLMDPRRRRAVLDTSLRTTAAALASGHARLDPTG